jgi:ferredoxin
MAISARPVSHYARLSEHPGPWADPAACLTVRFPATACHACQEVCPVSVLEVDSDGIRLAEGCLRCGRCAAACPTHALSMPGWQVTLPDDPPAVLEVDCAKVPDHLRAPGSVQVPCLGGLSHSRLLQWVNAHSRGQIALMDRGWCRGCDAGGSEHPATETVAQVNRWLAAVGVPEDRHVRLTPDPLPIRHMAGEIPDPSVRQTVSRRGFLRQLAGQVAVAAQGTDEHLERTGEPAPVDGSARIHPAERIAILARLSEASGDRAGTLPADLFHTASIDADRCRHDTICARSCPTTALRVWHGGGDTGVQFDPSACKNICHQCPARCGIDVYVTTAGCTPSTARPDHPISNGKLCPKGPLGTYILYDPDRFKGPMRRTNPQQGAQRGSGLRADLLGRGAGYRGGAPERSARSRRVAPLRAALRARLGGLLRRPARNVRQALRFAQRLHRPFLDVLGRLIKAKQFTDGNASYNAYDYRNANYLLMFGASFLEAFRPYNNNMQVWGYIRGARARRPA